MPDITVIIPVASYHIDLLPRALASVRAQTIPCAVLPIFDEAGKGAGWCRNRGLEQTTTEWVIFLDADDELMPTFAERTLAVAQEMARAKQPRYVYTDFIDTDGKRYRTSDCPWMEKRWHAVTTLMPLSWAQAVGGFDEDMEYAEDSEFYAHLTRTGHCGVRLPEVLFTYHKGGRRSKQGEFVDVRERIMREINDRYKEKIMGCCGSPPPSPALSAAYPKVKARPKWGMGKRGIVGSKSGYRYPRVDSSYVIDVDARDVDARPDLWEAVAVPAPNGKGEAREAVEEPPPAPVPFKELTSKLWRSLGLRQNVPAPFVPVAVEPVATKPDVERMMAFTRKAYADSEFTTQQRYETPAVHIQHDPVFVFPDKDYPSYTDVRRLVELSGFAAVKQSMPAGFIDGQTVIYLSPEQPPDELYTPFKSTIWWSLEYGGEYEPDLRGWRSEVWASDPAWAAAHNAQMVVMGSHPGLFDKDAPQIRTFYHFVMLAYQTHRRAALRAKLEADGMTTPDDVYPGYGNVRNAQLRAASLMLHAHQDDARRAIAPQRFALCAAYHLPLIYESVPDAGAYADYAIFADYDQLPAVTRDYLAGRYDDPLTTPLGERLYTWLCQEMTFRKCVMEALKG